MASTAAAYAAAQGFIDAQASAAGADARLGAVADLHRRRLWHQLTQAVLELVRDPAAAAPGGNNLVQVRAERRRRGAAGMAAPGGRHDEILSALFPRRATTHSLAPLLFPSRLRLRARAALQRLRREL